MPREPAAGRRAQVLLTAQTVCLVVVQLLALRAVCCSALAHSCCRHCSDTLMSGLLQLDLCTSLSVGLIMYTPPPLT